MSSGHDGTTVDRDILPAVHDNIAFDLTSPNES